MRPRLDIRHLQMLVAVAETGTVTQAAKRLGVHAVRIRQMIGDGTLYAVQVDGRWRIPEFQLQDEALVPDLREYTRRFGLTTARAQRLPKDTLVMHPGPMNRGVEMAVDPGELPTSVILDQVTNGIAVRMAVLFELLGGEA